MGTEINFICFPCQYTSTTRAVTNNSAAADDINTTTNSLTRYLVFRSGFLHFFLKT